MAKDRIFDPDFKKNVKYVIFPMVISLKLVIHWFKGKNVNHKNVNHGKMCELDSRTSMVHLFWFRLCEPEVNLIRFFKKNYENKVPFAFIVFSI